MISAWFLIPAFAAGAVIGFLMAALCHAASNRGDDD